MQSSFLLHGLGAGAIGVLTWPTYAPLPPAVPLRPNFIPLNIEVISAVTTQDVLLIITSLVALVLLVLFWRMTRQRRARTQAAEPTEAVAPPAPTEPVAASLEFADASGNAVSIVLNKPLLTLGRATDNDIVIAATLLNADTVSQHHAQLRRDKDDYIVRDLDSRNGLTVNGRHTIQNLLQDGDRVGFGNAEAIFHNLAPSGLPAQNGRRGPGGAA